MIKNMGTLSGQKYLKSVATLLNGKLAKPLQYGLSNKLLCIIVLDLVSNFGMSKFEEKSDQNILGIRLCSFNKIKNI